MAGRPVAIASESDHPVVVTCSRTAWDAGVRPGMTVLAARERADDLIVRSASGNVYRRAASAIAESLLALSTTVERGSDADDLAIHRAFYLYVPTGTRGDSFGAAVLAQLARQGFRARVGIADDRFSAWVAAATARGQAVAEGSLPFAQTTTSVPRGGSAVFLAPLPLGLLPLDPDVQSMLGSLGIETLGDFAELPPPSMGRRWNERGVDLRLLARGDDPTQLHGFTPRDPVVEVLELERPITDIEPLVFVLRPLLDRVCDRMRGRGAAVDRLALRLLGDGLAEPIILPLERPSLSGRELVDVVRAELMERALGQPVEAIEVAVLREIDVAASDLVDVEDDGGQLSLSPIMRPNREAHRRTMRTQRGKKNRRRRRTGDRIRGLFE